MPRPPLPEATARAAAIAAMGQRLAAPAGWRVRQRQYDAPLPADAYDYRAPPHFAAAPGEDPDWDPIPWDKLGTYARRAALLGSAATLGFGLVALLELAPKFTSYYKQFAVVPKTSAPAADPAAVRQAAAPQPLPHQDDPAAAPPLSAAPTQVLQLSAADIPAAPPFSAIETKPHQLPTSDYEIDYQPPSSPAAAPAPVQQLAEAIIPAAPPVADIETQPAPLPSLAFETDFQPPPAVAPAAPPPAPGLPIIGPATPSPRFAAAPQAAEMAASETSAAPTPKTVQAARSSRPPASRAARPAPHIPAAPLRPARIMLASAMPAPHAIHHAAQQFDLPKWLTDTPRPAPQPAPKRVLIMSEPPHNLTLPPSAAPQEPPPAPRDAAPGDAAQAAAADQQQSNPAPEQPRYPLPALRRPMAYAWSNYPGPYGTPGYAPYYPSPYNPGYAPPSGPYYTPYR